LFAVVFNGNAFAPLWQQTDEIEDMERALQILTVEYPRQAAMLEQLKTALGLEVLIYIY
jgi:hypothetical protein